MSPALADLAEATPIEELAEATAGPEPSRSSRSEQGMAGTEVLDVLNEHVDDSVVYVNETTTLDLDYLERFVIDRPGMYHFPASGGLGFGLPVAVGMALGDPEKTVVATVGDGSANYGLTALYTAAQLGTKTIFVIVNNSGYGALSGFAERMGVPDTPGLTLGTIDFVSLAQGYGVPASRTTTREEFDAAYREALQADGPVLIDAVVLGVEGNGGVKPADSCLKTTKPPESRNSPAASSLLSGPDLGWAASARFGRTSPGQFTSAGSAETRPPFSSASMAATSASVSSKSKTSKFCCMRSRLFDFGKTTCPFCRCQRMIA